MYVVTLCAQLRVELHVFSRATTTRRMTTPGVVLGLHPETCVPSAKISFFTSRMILGKLYTAVRSRTARSFPRFGASCSRVHSWAVVRSHVQRREDGHARAPRGPRGGALDRSGIVLPHRDELPARARPRVQPVRVSSTRSSPERRDDARRRDACIIDQMKTSSFNRRRAHSSPSVRALARERNDGANERTRDRWNVDVSRLDAMTRRTVRIGSIRFVQKSARRVNERTSGMIVFCRRESRNQKAGHFILGSRLYSSSLSHEPSTRPP